MLNFPDVGRGGGCEIAWHGIQKRASPKAEAKETTTGVCPNEPRNPADTSATRGTPWTSGVVANQERYAMHEVVKVSRLVIKLEVEMPEE